MADDTIPFDKNKRAFEKDIDYAAYLQVIFKQVVETHNQLQLRAKDLEKDAAELVGFVETVIGELAEKYPELVPDFEEDEIENP